ncbi:MAG: DUF3089 domain-containing protein [Caulobacterales bacterium]|nr:DUF3089 domain-containing protein [Caulobacterales bacterium]
MSTRRLSRLVLYTLAGFATFLAIVVVVFQDNVFRWAMDPRRPFQTTAPPPAPDYEDRESWALAPDAPDPRRIAVFFVHPTTYWGRRAWNAPIDEPRSRDRLMRAALPNHARPFEAVGQVWAPHYRQAALYASLTHRYDARRARALAFSDVARAFEAFMGDIAQEAPFMIVGVEQGGLHVAGLLQHALRNERARERLAAAYIIDQALPLDLFDEALSHLRPCAERADVRCVAAWGAVEADSGREIDRFRRRSMVWTPSGRLAPTDGRALACYNPVLGGAGEDFAPARLHRGGADATGLESGVAPALLRAQTSTQCRDGVLLIDQPVSRSLRDVWSLGRRYKPPRANLLYADIEIDARARVTAFAELWASEAHAAPPPHTLITLQEAPPPTTPE